MQTQINWIKYEGKTEGLNNGRYLVYGVCIRDGKSTKETRMAKLERLPVMGIDGDIKKLESRWDNLDSFIIEYITPLSEIERGIEEEVNKQK